MQIKNTSKSLMTKAKKFFSGIKHINLKSAPGEMWGYIKTHKMRSLIIGILVVAGIAGGAYLISRNQSKVTYVQYKVTRGDITETLDVVGSVQAIPSAVMTWKTDGIVADFSVKIGDQVNTGDTLMHLTDSSLDPSILQANANLLDAQLALDKLLRANTDRDAAAKALNDTEYSYLLAKENIDEINWQNTSMEKIQQARGEYQLTEQAYWRAQWALDTLQNKTADDPEKSTAQNTFNEAKKAKDKSYLILRDLLGRYYNYETETLFILYDQSVDALQEARLTWEKYQDMSDEVAAARATVQSYQNTVNHAAIIAPFDGTITNIVANAGDMASSGTSAAQIDNLGNLMITVDVSEVDINAIRVDQDVEITFDSLTGKTFHGKVIKVSNAGNASSGLVQFSITIQLTDADENIKPGFSATASIIISQVSDVLMVPTAAIQKGGQRNFVLLSSAAGTPSIIPVEIGASSDSMTQIISDQIKEGDTILVPVSGTSTTGLRSGFGMMGILGGEGGVPTDRQPPSGGNFQPRQGN